MLLEAVGGANAVEEEAENGDRGGGQVEGGADGADAGMEMGKGLGDGGGAVYWARA